MEAKFESGFIRVFDEVAKRSFSMFVRKDAWIETEFLEKGLYGGWEKESLRIWAFLSKISNTILDIGANTGTYALIAQNNNLKAKVIAIEPVEINFDFLAMNVKQNHFPIKLEKVALSDKPGKAKMFMLKDTVNYMTSVNDDRYALHPEIKGDSEVVEIEVAIEPYSAIHEKYKLGAIDLIKIDVEGHELTVLTAMFPYLKKYKPPVLIEIIGDENATALDRLFREAGYEKFVSIDEVNVSKKVEKLWDNDHHNFLICDNNTVKYLQGLGLVAT